VASSTSTVKSEAINPRSADVAKPSGVDWYEAPEQGDIFGARAEETVQLGERLSSGQLPEAAARVSSEQESFKPSFQPMPSHFAQSAKDPHLVDSSPIRPDSIHRKIVSEKLPGIPRVTREQLIQAQEMIQHGLSVDEVVARSNLAPEQVQLLMVVRQKQTEKRIASTRAPVKRVAVDPRLGVLGGARR
jgi:hypothetical protein